jgi:hypothetical protein
VIVDGLRADAPGDMAALGRARRAGAERVLMTSFPSVSIPQYYAALSGVAPGWSGAAHERLRCQRRAARQHRPARGGRGLKLATIGPHEPWFQPGSWSA